MYCFSLRFWEATIAFWVNEIMTSWKWHNCGHNFICFQLWSTIATARPPTLPSARASSEASSWSREPNEKTRRGASVRHSASTNRAVLNYSRWPSKLSKMAGWISQTKSGRSHGSQLHRTAKLKLACTLKTTRLMRPIHLNFNTTCVAILRNFNSQKCHKIN